MKTICLINMKGGVGKTTVAVNLADFLVKREGKRVLVMDVDPQFNATQCIMGPEAYIQHLQEGNPTIANIFNSTSETSVSLVSGCDQKHAIPLEKIVPISSTRGFDFIPGNLDLFRMEMGSGSGKEHRLKKYLDLHKANYDYAIIDSPPTPSVWMTSALIASDYYLIPVKPDPISMTGIDLLSSIIAEKSGNYGFQCKCCGVVLTMVEKASTQYKEAVKFFSESSKWKSHIIDKHYILKRVEIARQQLRNGYIIDSTDSTLKSDFSFIVKEIMKRAI